MTREEAKTLVRLMCTAWPNYHPENIAETVSLWHKLLESYPFPLMAAALQAYMLQNNAFAPAPGQLIAIIPREEGHSELEAWGMVRKAIRNGSYGAEEEFYKLPEDIQKAVGSPEQLRAWAIAPEEDTETVMQSNFLRSYRTVKKREEQLAGIPANIRNILLGGMKHEMELPGKHD